MNEIYQEGTLAITDNNADINNAYNFFNLLESGQYITSQFMHAIKDNISMLLWSEASCMRQGYFAEEITAINYQNKALWDGIFNESLEFIKQEVINGATVAVTNIDLLKEQLYELQGLVGKYTLSPQDYEQGLEDLKQYFVFREDIEVSKSIEEVRLTFIKELTEQPEVLGECLEGDITAAFEQEAGEFKIRALKDILSYYKPLFKDAEIYNKYLSWVKNCYEKQNLLPLPHNELSSKASNEDLELAAKLPTIIAKDKHNDLSWLGLQYLSKIIWENKGTIITLFLASQGAMGQVLSNNRGNTALMTADHVSSNNTEFMPLLSSDNFDVSILVNKTNTELLYKAASKLLELEFTQSKTRTADEVLSRTKRKVPDNRLGNKQKCHYKLNEIQNLQSVLNESVQELKTNKELENDSNTDNSNENNNDLCHKSIKETQQLAEEIQIRLQLLKKGQLNGPLWQELFKDSQQKIKELGDEINSLKSINTVQSANFTTTLAAINQAYASLTTEYNNLKKDHDAYKIELEQEKIITDCTTHIHEEQYQLAVDEFKKLNDNSKLSEIIRKAYGNSLDQFDRIVEFIRKLPYISQHVMSYRTLFERMQANNHLSKAQILVFIDMVQEVMDMPNYINISQDSKNKATQLKKELDNYLKAFMTGLGEKIRAGNYEEIKSYVKKSVRAANSVNYHFPEIAKNALKGTGANFDATLKFIDDLHWRSHKFTGYAALADAVRMSIIAFSQTTKLPYGDKLMQLAYKAKSLLDGDSAYVVEFRPLIKRSFPDIVTNIIFGHKCSLKNAKRPEYLYAANDYFNHQVFTWIPGNEVREAYWRFEPQTANTAYIKNTYYDKYLNTRYEDNLFSGEKLIVSVLDSSTTWEIELVNNYHLTLARSGLNKLYSDDSIYNKDRRYVSIYYRDNPEAAIWKLECSDN